MDHSACSLATQQLVIKRDPRTIAEMTAAYDALRERAQQHREAQRRAAYYWQHVAPR